MQQKFLHTFHIPVMGLAYTIDTPLRVAHYGIDSVVSIVDDDLIEKMNAYYCKKFNINFNSISTKVPDYRALRITSYLNLMHNLVKEKFRLYCEELCNDADELEKLISMLPQKADIIKSLQGIKNVGFAKAKGVIEKYLSPGAIDVNIMTKVDKINYKDNEALPHEYNDAHSALRGFANSKLNSSVVLSAGMNPSLYNYIATFPDFFPDENGDLKKRVTLKVSDFRSAMVQGSFLAKKGVWVSEYRIESGLNCGGHAFATEGILMGPIMEEFKQRRAELIETTHNLLVKALAEKACHLPGKPLPVRITAQGGIGTAEEHQFILEYYNTDSVGWGSPFLLVPEATATDPATRKLLANATEKDLYRSDISPLGVPFNSIKGTTNEYIRERRIKEGKEGSSCPKKLLALNRDYGEEGICTASRKYQKLKLSELDAEKDNYGATVTELKKKSILVKSCLCVGLANSVYIENHIPLKGEQQGVVICPGPNMAYFDKEVPLSDMVGHIYGHKSVLASGYRPNIFIKELELYVGYLRDEIANPLSLPTKAQIKKWNLFKENLLQGINYYQNLFTKVSFFADGKEHIMSGLLIYKEQIGLITIPEIIN